MIHNKTRCIFQIFSSPYPTSSRQSLIDERLTWPVRAVPLGGGGLNVSDLESMLRKAYSKLKNQSRNLKWPSGTSGIEVSKGNGLITLHIKDDALKKNMQSNENAFEGWVLALKDLVYQDCNFSIAFERGENTDKHYQRFLTRLWAFNSLFGNESSGKWFELSPTVQGWLDSDCSYSKCRREKKSLQCNTGQNGRGEGKVGNSINLAELSEADLELMLCKVVNGKNCLTDTFNIKGNVYRQFPVGIFKDKVTNKNALFPGEKACVDLVADDKRDAFWLFELKKQGNIQWSRGMRK